MSRLLYMKLYFCLFLFVSIFVAAIFQIHWNLPGWGDQIRFEPQSVFTHTRDHFEQEDRYSDGQINLLILTYMRSGSSLTGDIFREGPNTFYVYEPLHAMKIAEQNNEIMTFLNGTIIEHIENNAYRVLKSWFCCDLKNLDTVTLSEYFLRRTRFSSTYYRCQHTRKLLSLTERLNQCAMIMQNLCKKNIFRVIKTVRTSMEIAEKLMHSLPNLKILHLIRDPRATQLSRLEVGMFGFTNVWEMPEKLCKQISDDLDIGLRMKSLFNGRYKILRYEDLADNPLERSRGLYDFLENNFTKSVKQFVFDITLAGNEDSCVICSMRNNSREHIDKWRKNINIKHARAIDSACQNVYKIMGYLPVANTFILKNRSIPLLINNPPAFPFWERDELTQLSLK